MSRGGGAVFVVDDNRLTRLLLSDAVRAAGYDPVEFALAREALDAIRDGAPLACLVDHTMPEMSGAEFIRALRASEDGRLRTLPVIGVTSGFQKELSEAGATACIQKPASEANIATALSAAIARQPAAEAADAAATRRKSTIAEFRQLHERARTGLLTGPALELYRSMRAELAETFLALQHVAMPARARGRRALRVAEQLRVDLQCGGQPVYAETVDVGQGGFSAIVKSPFAAGARLAFRLHLSERDAIDGFVRVANSAPAGDAGQRVGFAFVGLGPEQRDRLDMRVFDAVVAQLDGPNG